MHIRIKMTVMYQKHNHTTSDVKPQLAYAPVLTDLFAEPDADDRHAGNDGVGVLLGGRVHCIVGSNHQRQVNLSKK